MQQVPLSQCGAIKNGLQYAKDGKGASSAVLTKYKIPWDTKAKAVTGGAIFIGSSYINIGQYTVYLQKFHVNDENGGALHWHQYMTNVLAPYSESKLIYNGYANSLLLTSSMDFVIPVYNNMPQIPTQSPSILDSDYIQDNTLMYADVTGTLNVRNGPGTSYEVITQITNQNKVTRIYKGIQNGELWDRVILENGMHGYIFGSYLKEIPNVEISNIQISLDKTTLNKGENKSLTVSILPEEAKGQKIKFSSSNMNCVYVDNDGNLYPMSSGTSNITAKTESGNVVSNTLTLTVKTSVNDLIVDNEKVNVFHGDSFKINAIILPEDADNKEVIWNSQNSSIVSVGTDGTVTGVSDGTTTVTVTSKDGNIQKSIEVKVKKKAEENEIIFDDKFVIQSNLIAGLNAGDTKVSNIKKLINTQLNATIYNFKEEELSENSNVGTGSKIVFSNEADEVIEEYNFILYGDVNGDGKINTVDILLIQKHILKMDLLNGLFIKAANILKDGKNPNSVDILRIQKHILKMEEIIQ